MSTELNSQTCKLIVLFNFICMYIHSFIHPSTVHVSINIIYPSVNISSIHPSSSIHLSIYPSIHPYIFIHPPITLLSSTVPKFHMISKIYFYAFSINNQTIDSQYLRFVDTHGSQTLVVLYPQHKKTVNV